MTESGLRWAATSLLGHVDLGWLATDGAIDLGILTATDGLLVQSPGFKLSFPDRPKGMSPNLEPVTKDLVSPFARDEYGSWSIFWHRSAPEQDISKRSLWEMLQKVVRSGLDVWAIHPKTKGNIFLVIDVVACIAGESGYRKARSKIHMLLFENFLGDFLESFYTLAKQLSESEASKKIANFDNGSEIDSNLPEYKIAMEAWEAELHRLARSEKAKSAFTASNFTSSEGKIADFIAHLFWGHYFIKGETAPANQRWCID